MMRFMKHFKHIENYHVKYLTKDDITATNLPLFVSSNSTFCKELQVSLGVYKSHKQVPLTFTDLMDDWDEEEGGEFVKVAPCTFKDKAILFVELVIRENEKLNTKSIVTKYLSSSQHTILLSHIDNIIAGGITDSAIPNTVNNCTIPPSFSVMHALQDGFSLVLFSNTHNNQQKPYTINRSMGLRLKLKDGMTLIWNGYLLHCGAKSRTTIDGIHLNDTRWFNYYWTNIKTVGIKRRPREDGTNLHRKGLNMCQCFKGLPVVIHSHVVRKSLYWIYLV